jgi:Mrp family chromosome partitioning ATPase
MGHLLEAIKKLEQKRGAARPEPVHRPLAKHAAKTWRIDETHRRGPVGTFEPHFAAAPDHAATAPNADEIQRADANPPAPDNVPTPLIAAVPEAGLADTGSGQCAADVVWQFAVPAIPSDYHNLAARLVGEVDRSLRPQSVLLTAVSRAACDAVSIAVLAQAMSSQGSVLWIDTRKARPTADAAGPMEGQDPGWHELRAGKATWEEIIVPTNLPGVSFVGCGHHRLGHEKLEFGRQLFVPLRLRFSVVLIHGGLADDAATIAPLCDVIGLVTVIGKTTRSEVDWAIQTLAAVGGRPLMIAVEPHRA